MANVISRSISVLLLAFISASSVFAAELARDADKYPQDTPQKALTSIISALEGKNSEYWLTWLVTPESSNHVKEKYGSIEKAIAVHRDEHHAEMIKQRHELMKKMLAENKTTEGEENGVKWTRFHADDKVLELDLQPDGRWCMNMHVTSDKKSE